MKIRSLWSILGFMALLACLTGCGDTSSVNGGTTTSSAVTPTASANAPTTTPTGSTPAPAGTPTAGSGGSGILTGATLGGTDAAFAARYQSHGGGVFQQTNLLFTVYYGNGTDGAQHASSINAGKIDATTWTQEQAQQICMQFNPPDAAHQSDTHDGQGDLVQIYRSARLGQTFGTALFAPQSVGTFSIDYLRKPGESGVFQCVLHLGSRV